MTTTIQFLLALLLVLIMMGGLALILKFVGGGRHIPMMKNKRLKIVEILPLDHKRRAILIQRDDKQHLLVLGQNSETVVETNIKPIKQIDDEK
ncbi:MAG: flagellar biosynthetic protein FliO [Bdellovibrionales bacterium]